MTSRAELTTGPEATSSADARLAASLAAARPRLEPEVRESVRRGLVASRPDAARVSSRTIAAYAGSGGVLLGVAALGLTGSGPLGF